MAAPIQQGGAIVVRRKDGRPQVLIVSARRNRKRWVLPKGSVERGERPRDAALREAREEAGVAGTLRGKAGAAEYNARAGRVRIEYYLVEYRRALGGEHENRRVKWCSVEDAIKRLTYASARRVLLEAHEKVVRMALARRRPL